MPTAAALVFAGKSVATPAISFLVTKAFTYLKEYRRTAGMEEMEKRIRLALPNILVVFDVVNPVYIKEMSSTLDAWLWQLRDAVEEAEDALDEIEYHELEEKAKDRKVSDWGSSGAKMKHEVVRSIKHVSILDKTVKSLTQRGTLKRLRKSVEVLDRTAARVADFLALAQHLKGCTSQQEYFLNRNRETGSTITATEVFGRCKEKELVVGWLTSHEDAEIVVSTNHVSVVSIVGHGGMGKTTLAQLVYQDDGVTNHFDKVIWACVSTSFDATTVISNILESATWAKPDANTYEALQQILREKLNSVKFLLILDDVWEDEKTDQWEKLFAPLRTGKSGSKILLTTRMQRVADVATRAMRGEQKCLPLQGLEEDENIKLFNHHAFANLNLQDYAGLQSIGEQIAKKATGCPLVTKVIGAHLRDNMTTEFWDRFLHEGLDHFKGTEKDIMGVLRLSYYHLPTELQTCFRYCSIFSQDYKFKKEELVKMWMSSGLISQTETGPEDLIEIGEWYLVQLTRKSFFDLRFETNNRDTINEEPAYYVMHDLMHDLAKDVSSGECARIVDVASFENVMSTVRHIHVEDTCNLSAEEIQKKFIHWNNLRTVIIGRGVYKGDILRTLQEAIVNSKSLRLFKTKNSYNTSHLLGSLGKLKHLRCIMLPQLSPKTSICGLAKLYHLRILSCASANTEPKHFRDLGKLDRLQYVAYGSFGFGNFPVGRLTSLRFLKNYQVQGSKGYTISALKDLRSLRQLGLRGLENVANHEEAEDAKLNEKQYLQSLSLEWAKCNGAQSRTHDLIIDHLEPHANLKKLRISGYNGNRLPNWIVESSVKNLLKLEFESCGNCEQLPFLAELRLLKHLELTGLPKLKNIGQALDVSRSACIEFSLPPSLGALVIRNCPELGELPPLPPSLVSFEIAHVGLTRLPRIGKLCSKSIETMSSQLLQISVTDCPRLTWSEGSLLEQTQCMGALRVLRIRGCVHLESYASLVFEEMTGLRELEIRNCPKLRTLRNVGDSLLPSSLEKLTMGQCGNLELPLLGSLQRLTNLSMLVLRNCSGLVSLPCADAFGTSLKSLKYIMIKGCENLSSLGGLGSVPYLGQLRIVGCSKLAEVGSSHQIPHASGGKEENLAPIGTLVIDLPSLLLVEPIKSLRQTQRLSILDGSEMETLPAWWLLQNRTSLHWLKIQGAKSLESLPPSMRDLSSLERLVLCGAGKLRSLPDLPSSLRDLILSGAGKLRSLPDLPSSLRDLTISGAGELQSLPDMPSLLRYLYISGCDSELEKKSRGYASPGLNRISHIRKAHIGNLRFIMGKECNQETYNILASANDATISSWVNGSRDGQRIVAEPHWLKKHFCLENAS